MGKIQVVRGNKLYAPQIRRYLEQFCGCKSNPNALACSEACNFYFVNEHGELDFKYDFEFNLDDIDKVSIETVLFYLGQNLKESYKNVQNIDKVKCSNKAQSYVDYFDDILKEMSEVHQRKNADYGNNFHKRYEKYGFLTALLRLTDKMERLENIYEKGEIQVKDESVEDTLLDLANYAVMTIVELKNGKNNN